MFTPRRPRKARLQRCGLRVTARLPKRSAPPAVKLKRIILDLLDRFREPRGKRCAHFTHKSRFVNKLLPKFHKWHTPSCFLKGISPAGAPRLLSFRTPILFLSQPICMKFKQNVGKRPKLWYHPFQCHCGFQCVPHSFLVRASRDDPGLVLFCEG